MATPQHSASEPITITGTLSDPTPLTTQQLNSAIVALRDHFNARIDGLVGIHGTRIDAIEKRLDHKYVETASEISHLRDLAFEKIQAHNDKFILTDRVFQEHFSKIDQQFKDQTDATALALNAADKRILDAFHAAEKAAAKADLAAEKIYLESQIGALREAFTQQIRTQKDALEAALASSDKAVLKAEVASERRFESVNEFRSTLSDQQRDLATKAEVSLRFEGIESRLNTVIEDAREFKGSRTVSDPAITSTMRDMRSEISALQSSSDHGSGRREQGSASMALIISIIVALAVVGEVIANWVTFASRAH